MCPNAIAREFFREERRGDILHKISPDFLLIFLFLLFTFFEFVSRKLFKKEISDLFLLLVN